MFIMSVIRSVSTTFAGNKKFRSAGPLYAHLSLPAEGHLSMSRLRIPSEALMPKLALAEKPEFLGKTR